MKTPADMTNEEVLDSYAVKVCKDLIAFCEAKAIPFEAALESAIAIVTDMVFALELEPKDIQADIQERYDVLYGSNGNKVSVVEVKEPKLSDVNADRTLLN